MRRLRDSQGRGGAIRRPTTVIDRFRAGWAISDFSDFGEGYRVSYD